MNSLRLAVDDYLATHRALGYKLEGVGFALRSFAAFAEREGEEHVTIRLALRWANASGLGSMGLGVSIPTCTNDHQFGSLKIWTRIEEF